MSESFHQTPSGLVIRFEDGARDPETGKAKRRQYWINDEKVPSITTVLGAVIDKSGGMLNVAEKLTVGGCVALAQQESPAAFQPPPSEGDLQSVLDGLELRGWRFQQQWDRRALIGTETHTQMEGLMAGDLELDKVSPAAGPFVEGVLAFMEKHQPRTVQMEVMVASQKHKVAGRFDWFGLLPPTLGDKTLRLDLKTIDEIPRNRKTNKILPPYESNIAQLGGYEGCAKESGEPAADYHGILRVDKTGDYNLWLMKPVSFTKCYLPFVRAYRCLQDVRKCERVEVPQRQEELA